MTRRGKPTVEVVGIYPVEAAEPCHLVELVVRGSDGRFDPAGFTPALPDQPRSEWQVPYAEKVLDHDGRQVLWDPWTGPGEEALWRGDVRLAFFFHYLDVNGSLMTPFGVVALPAATERPRRLDALTYEAP